MIPFSKAYCYWRGRQQHITAMLTLNCLCPIYATSTIVRRWLEAATRWSILNLFPQRAPFSLWRGVGGEVPIKTATVLIYKSLRCASSYKLTKSNGLRRSNLPIRTTPDAWWRSFQTYAVGCLLSFNPVPDDLHHVIYLRGLINGPSIHEPQYYTTRYKSCKKIRSNSNKTASIC